MSPLEREPARVLIVEDEPNLLELARDVLSQFSHRLEACSSIAEAEARLQTFAPDLLLLDVRLPDGDGLFLLERLRSEGFLAPVIVMTAYGTVERAVAALRAGATDFLVKPFDNARLMASVAAALETGKRLEEIGFSAGLVEETPASKALIGAASGLRDVVALLPKVSGSDATVLIRGESGTGKELIARAIHASSPRMDGPFVSVNCAALPGSLLESELFGFERGAFTGAFSQRKGVVESAHGGTLFLDEIGDMSLEAQARLLRVLQEREVTRIGGREPVKVDVRVVAATHRDLRARVTEGSFREDLLYRLDVIPITLPPLRDRRQDIPGLVQHFLTKHSGRGARSARVDEEVLGRLAGHHWPGNVRELENLVERAVVLGRFVLDGLGESPVSTPGRPASVTAPEATRFSAAEPATDPAQVRPLREVVAEAERRAVVIALRTAKGNKAEAARLLGVSYKTLFNKIHEHQIKEQLNID